MFLRLFLALRAAGVPATLGEYLDLLAAVRHELHRYSIDDFYALTRALLVKDERHFDTFDRIFTAYAKGLELIPDQLLAQIPADWLRQENWRELTEAEKADLDALAQSLGGPDALLELFRQRLEEQDERHTGGNRWIGTEGTSPLGTGGYNPEGLVMGDGGQRRGIKAWEQRRFDNLREDLELNTRALKLALRKLRRLTREGLPTELDLDATIDRTSRAAGLLDLAFVASRQNRVKVLLLIDVGGSMAPYARLCSELFSAARHEFKHLEFYYFHNCIYEHVWRDNLLRHSGEGRVPTLEVLRTYGTDYKVIFIGDAAMSPYELMAPGGSLEHPNPEPGIAWISRFADRYPALVWLNPEPQRYWSGTHTLTVIRQRLEGRMFPLTLEGLGQAIRHLKAPSLRPEGFSAKAA